MCATIRNYTVITVHYVNFILHSTVSAPIQIYCELSFSGLVSIRTRLKLLMILSTYVHGKDYTIKRIAV